MSGIIRYCRILTVVTAIVGCLNSGEVWPLGIKIGEILQVGNEPMIKNLQKYGFVKVDNNGEAWLPVNIEKTIGDLKEYDETIKATLLFNRPPDGVKVGVQVAPRMELNIRYLPGTGRIRGYTMMGHVDAIVKNETDQIKFCQGAINETPKDTSNVVTINPTGEKTKVDLAFVTERLQRRERIWFNVSYQNVNIDKTETRMNYEIGYDDSKFAWYINATCQRTSPGDNDTIKSIKDRITNRLKLK